MKAAACYQPIRISLGLTALDPICHLLDGRDAPLERSWKLGGVSRNVEGNSNVNPNQLISTSWELLQVAARTGHRWWDGRKRWR